jgi:hypothetical protein
MLVLGRVTGLCSLGGVNGVRGRFVHQLSTKPVALRGSGLNDWNQVDG